MKIKLRSLVVVCSLMIVSAAAAQVKVETDADKGLYSLGTLLARNLAPYDLDARELGVVTQGMKDAVLKKKLAVSEDKVEDEARAFLDAREKAQAKSEKEAAKDFLKKAAKEKGAVKTESGMIIKVIKPGTGKIPKETDTVKVHYVGTLRDGTVFDSSRERGRPAVFPLNHVIPCWTEGLQKMKVGEKAKLVCPPDLAYGDHGRPPKIKPGATLVFEVELLEIVQGKKHGMMLPPGHP